MDKYQKEWIDGATPLIFAVDATGVPLGNGLRNDDSNRKPNDTFAHFYEYITSKKNIPKVQPPAVPNDPSANVRKTPSKTTKNLSSFDILASGRDGVEKSDFFSHARVLPVSHRHAFPPSKDPHGNLNAISKLNSSLYAVRNQKMVPAYDPHSSDRSSKPISPVTAILGKNPILGILPEGWIEKHTHALPSTIMIVASLDLTASTEEQAQLEEHLASTIQNITSSCAKKRESMVHAVCIVRLSGAVATPKEALIESEWVANIKSTCRLAGNSVTCLHYYEDVDNQSGENATIFLQNDFEKLQNAIEDESLLYYLTQVRRCKRKYTSLHHGKFPELKPFAVRYCIKIAMFYEFQGCIDSERRDKSLRYWNEAYRLLKDYYLYLQGISSDDKVKNGATAAASGHNKGRVLVQNKDKSNGGNTLLEERNGNDTNSEYVPDDGVEVALLDAPRDFDSEPKSTSTNQNMDDESSTMDELGRKKSGDSTVGDADDDQKQFLTRSRDMFQQCRSVADLLNIKLLVIIHGYAVESLNRSNNVVSSHDFTFKTLARQIRTHIQVFLSPPNDSSSVHNYNLKEPTWSLLSYVAQQRFVISEFLQKYPVPSNGSPSIDSETLSYCNAFHHYNACGKLFLRLDEAMGKLLNEAYNPITDKVAPKHDDKQRFVGGVGAHDTELSLHKESKRDQLGLALESFKRAVEVASEKDGTSARTMSSIYYFMGRIHMKRGKLKLAADLLKKTRSLVQGFPLIQIVVDTALKECLENVDQASCTDIATMQVLNCEQNALLTKKFISSLCTMLKKRCLTELKWKGAGEPFHYSFTFPYNLYASESDRLKGILHVRSNLPFPVKIEKIGIQLNLGKVVVNQRKIVSPYTVIQFDSVVTIPICCMKDVDAKILERQGAKSPRPNTFGLTQIGGAVFGESSLNKLSGGVVVGCLSADFLFSLHPDNEVRFSINIENRHRGSFQPNGEQYAANKRSAIEEDNFVFSAWDRPDCFPVSFGPRCLRLFRAYSQLDIINLTSECTEGKVMEGTVNKIVLKLKPGIGEKCRNVRWRISCNSWLDYGFVDNRNAIDALNNYESSAPSRLPVILEPDPHRESEDNDYCLPGWKSLNSDDWHHVAEIIDGGSECFVSLYFYRLIGDNASVSELKCMTKYTVDFSYERNTYDPVDGQEIVESVSKTYEDTISWCAPLETKFDVIRQKEYITTSTKNITSRSDIDQIGDHTVISGTEVILSCSVFCPEAASNMSVKLNSATYQPTTEKSVNVSLLNNRNGINTEKLYDTEEDFSSDIIDGSRFKISCLLRASLIDINSSELKHSKSISSPLGTISIIFTPRPLLLAQGTSFLQGLDYYSRYHGPLPLPNLPPIQRISPTVSIEMTPFDASFETIPSVPTVGSPFEVRYTIKNKSHFHQKLRISVIESEGTDSGMLVSGTINGNLFLGPGEEKHVCYTILIAKVGETELPTLNVYSLRYNEFIIHNCTRKIFVMP